MRFAACFPLLLVAALGACRSDDDDREEEPADSVRSTKIIGTNDLVPVAADGANIPAKYRSLLDAFGRMGGCSATLIGNGLAITAGHCFGAGRTAETNLPCSRSVAWGYRKDRPAYLTSRCEVVLAAENGERDYALFVVRPIPPVSVPIRTTRPSDGSMITIFGHPRRRPLEWSQTCAIQPSTDPASSTFRYECDTEPASSGSSVLDDTSLDVVGIHNDGTSRWNDATFIADTPIPGLMSGEGVAPPAASAP